MNNCTSERIIRVEEKKAENVKRELTFSIKNADCLLGVD